MDWGMTIPYIGITLVKLLVAIAILVVGLIMVKVIVSLFRRQMRRTKLSDVLVEFLAKFFSALLYVIVILLVLGTLGVAIGSVILSLSAIVGLVLGFGLQDTFNNVASGAWIAALGPLEIGDVVTLGDKTGKVTSVGIMATELLTLDNTYIAIPNKLVWDNPIVNATRMPTRRVDVSVGVAYESSVDKAIETGLTLMRGHDLVLDDPEPAVAVTELADSSVNLQLRAWTKTENYWAVMGALTQGILEALPPAGVEIPFPQIDVHMKQA